MSNFYLDKKNGFLFGTTFDVRLSMFDHATLRESNVEHRKSKNYFPPTGGILSPFL